MKILIIEDEALAAKDLKRLLKELEPDIHILEVLKSVADSIKWFQQHEKPDLIISDIQLSDGISFEIFEKVNTNTPIIFTTAYDAYAIKAFKVNGIDYLLKPIDEEQLRVSLKKFRLLKESSVYNEQVKQLLNSYLNKTEEKKYRERFLAELRNSIIPIATENIATFCKDELIYIHTFDQQKLICDARTLDEVEHLVDPKSFYRANRQYIININSVDKIKSTYKGLTVVLKSPVNQEVDISREKAADFKRWLEVV
jgi:two-component system, LytTR family, response regulator